MWDRIQNFTGSWFAYAFLFVNRLCMLVCFGVPFIGAILPLLTNDYGPAGVYCGVKATVTGIIWRFVM